MRSKALTTTTTALSAAALVALTSCGGQEVEIEEAEAGGEPVTPGEETTLEAQETNEADADEDESEESETEAPGEAELPPGGAERMEESDFDESVHGESQETFYSEEGAEVGVAGLLPEDVPLEIHAEPTPETEIIAELEPTDAVVLGGHERSHVASENEGSWVEIQLADGYGWVHQDNLYYFGQNADATDDYSDHIDPAPSSEDIAESVGEHAIAEWDPDGAVGDWRLVTTPEDQGEDFYRVDVVGMMDDAQAGYRLFVHVEETDAGQELVQVESTLLCSRGVSEDGLCL